ncbi:MAG: helix-turn-helix transcriptional regulator [Spirochaetales bacterium]
MVGPLIAVAIAILTTTAAFGAATVLYSRWKTRALKFYLLFVATIVLFTTAMGLFALADAVGLPGLRDLSLVLQAIGGVVHVAVLPHFIYTISNRYPSRRVRIVFGTLSAVMALLSGAYFLWPTLQWIAYLLTTILYSSIAWALVQTAWWQRRKRDRRYTERSSAGDLDNGPELRTFLWVSVAFLPLFILDVLVTTLRWDAPWRYLEGLPLPVYLILITTGSTLFALRRFNMPALYAGEHVTPYCRKRFGLTEREAEVVEYVMDGYSVPDLASLLRISPKTAEHHLYHAYRKLAVSNRIQLYQTLMAHTQE